MMGLLGVEISAAPHSDLFNKGVASLKQGDFQEAIDVFSRLIDQDPLNPDVYRNRGVAYMKVNNYDAAISDFESALKIRPDIKGIYSNLGVAWYYKKEYARAISYYDREIQFKTDNHYAYFNRALCRAAQGSTEQALDDVNESIRLYPEHYPAVCLKADILAAMGRETAAITVYEQAMALDPEQAYAKKRLTEMKTGMPDAATGTVIHGKSTKIEKKTGKQKFALQSGGFKIKENADKMMTRIAGKGAAPRLLELIRPNGQKWFLVRLGGYASMHDAKTALEKMQANLGMELIIRPYGQF